MQLQRICPYSCNVAWQGLSFFNVFSLYTEHHVCTWSRTQAKPINPPPAIQPFSQPKVIGIYSVVIGPGQRLVGAEENKEKIH